MPSGIRHEACRGGADVPRSIWLRQCGAGEAGPDNAKKFTTSHRKVSLHHGLVDQYESAEIVGVLTDWNGVGLDRTRRGISGNTCPGFLTARRSPAIKRGISGLGGAKLPFSALAASSKHPMPARSRIGASRTSFA